MIPELRQAVRDTAPHGRLKVLTGNQVLRDLCQHLGDIVELSSSVTDGFVGCTIVTDLRNIPKAAFNARCVIIICYKDEEEVRERTIESVQDNFELIRVSKVTLG